MQSLAAAAAVSCRALLAPLCLPGPLTSSFSSSLLFSIGTHTREEHPFPPPTCLLGMRSRVPCRLRGGCGGRRWCCDICAGQRRACGACVHTVAGWRGTERSTAGTAGRPASSWGAVPSLSLYLVWTCGYNQNTSERSHDDRHGQLATHARPACVRGLLPPPPPHTHTHLRTPVSELRVHAPICALAFRLGQVGWGGAQARDEAAATAAAAARVQQTPGDTARPPRSRN